MTSADDAGSRDEAKVSVPAARLTLGQLLDALGATMELDENQHLTDVVILGKAIDFTDDSTALVTGGTRTDWITRRGIMESARLVYREAEFGSET